MLILSTRTSADKDKPFTQPRRISVVVDSATREPQDVEKISIFQYFYRTAEKKYPVKLQVPRLVLPDGRVYSKYHSVSAADDEFHADILISNITLKEKQRRISAVLNSSPAHSIQEP